MTAQVLPRIPFLASKSKDPDADGLFPIKRDYQVQQVQNALVNYESSFAPLAFQRPESWGKDDKKLYFQSILMDRAEGTFVLVDVVACLKRIAEVNPNDRAYDFFKNECAGRDWVILDANNRFHFLDDLVNDRWRIPKGTYRVSIEGGIVELVVGSYNNVFSKLPDIIQKYIKQRKLIISEYCQISYSGMSEVFLNVNGGVPLNAQEKRNAMDSTYSGWFRNLATEHGTLLTKVIGKEYHKRFKGCEFLVDTVDFITRCTKNNIVGVSQGTKNTLYKSEFFEEDDDKEIREALSIVSDYVDKIHTEISEGTFQVLDTPEKSSSALNRPSTVCNLTWLIYNGCKDYEDVKKALILHEAQYKNPNRLNDAGQNYVWACGGIGAKNNQLRMEVLNEILEQLGYQEEDEGPLYEVA